MLRRSLVASLASVLVVLVGCGGDGQSASTSTQGHAGKAGQAGQAGQAGRAGQGGGAFGAGRGGAAGASSGASCKTSLECSLPQTAPPGCVEATCDAGVCRFRARDADGDGHGAASCKPADSSVVIALGDDCNDADKAIHPGAWDGPADASHPSACDDGVDQDCSGKADDGSAMGKTCACTPGDVRACDQDSAGKPIAWPKLVAGTPVGDCKRGAQTCLANGAFGPCTGAVVPLAESCDKRDNDCDGETDEGPPADAFNWFYDGDGDNYGDKDAKPVLSCFAPTVAPAGCANCAIVDAKGESLWRRGIPATDCNDKDGGVNPGAAEICNGKDDDCNPASADETAPGVGSWYWDGDGDGYISTSEQGVASCKNPGTTAERCRGSSVPCTEKWRLADPTKSGNDCDDADALVNPGAWDGPATVSYGLVEPGLAVAFFAQAAVPVPDGLTAVKTDTYATASGSYPDGIAIPGLNKDGFTVLATGTIVAPQSGKYVFSGNNDDSYRIQVGTTTSPVFGCCTTPAFEVELIANQPTAIRLDLVEAAKWGGFELRWTGPGVPENSLVRVRDLASLGEHASSCDGRDQNCNNQNDEGVAGTRLRCPAPGVECTDVGLATWCGDLSPTKAVGRCNPGRKVCGPDGRWSPCEGGVDPVGEICGNGVDDDCNGQTDENNGSYYFDGDGDGFGDPNNTKQGCGLGPQWVANNTDCNDGVGGTHPGAPEKCDTVDNNCNGANNEGFDLSPCSRGVGACKTTGNYVCDGDGNGSTCTAPPAGTPATYAQQGPAPNGSEDWDCNGSVTYGYVVTGTYDQFGASCGQYTTQAACGSTNSFQPTEHILQSATATGPLCGRSLQTIKCWWSSLGGCAKGQGAIGGLPFLQTCK